jgi:hypothetical protein
MGSRLIPRTLIGFAFVEEGVCSRGASGFASPGPQWWWAVRRI